MLRLIYEVPGRPQDKFVLGEGERRDIRDKPIIDSGEEFEVTDKRARELLALYYPKVREAPAKPDATPAPVPVVNIADVKDETKAAKATKPGK